MWLVQDRNNAMLTVVNPRMSKDEQYESRIEVTHLPNATYNVGDKVVLLEAEDCEHVGGFLSCLYDPELLEDEDFISSNASLGLVPELFTVCDHKYL